MTREAVVCIHGLWVNGLDMSLLRHRLGEHYEVYQFTYSSVVSTPAENAARLNDFLQRIESSTVHLVAHSLGGIVVRHLYQAFPRQAPGRVVTLGSPHKGSHSAQQLDAFSFTRLLLGRSTQAGLLGDIPPWQQGAELGSIAGTLRFGMGVVIPGLEAPNDGTVSVAETRLEGMVDHVCLPLSHFGLLLSSQAFEQIVNFLRHGKFLPTPNR